MKRKRGKKNKGKKPAVVGTKEAADPIVVSLNTEDNSGLDGFDNDEFNSGMEVETPSSVAPDQPEKLASTGSDKVPEKAAVLSVYGRVKVKIKSSKALDSQITSSDVPTRSENDTSSQQVGLEKTVVTNEQKEDSKITLPEMNTAVSGIPSKKSGSIKIKSSNSIGSSSINHSRNVVLVHGDRTQQNESKLLHRGPRYNEQELNDSLEVIKKIMKMDAAEPFNAPVNPVALGIPDYFDVIDTPMDFGTICSNLENGVKYMNSEDVFKDVQYIWNNCYKYNNKGDYVLELMKRVKKNFMKYWTAAGLYSKQPQGTNGTESIADDATPPSHGKMKVKGAHFKHKSRKKHGVKKHKDDCLCAICVMMRRRQEREASTQIVEQLNGTSTSQSPFPQELKPEETSPVESPGGEDSSSNMENSTGPDAETDTEEKGQEVKFEGTDQLHSFPEEKPQLDKDKEMEIQAEEEGHTSERSQLDDRSEGEHNKQYQIPTAESGGDVHSDAQKEEMLMQQENDTAAAEPKNPKELPDKREKIKMMYENLRRFENPKLLELCGSLFPVSNHKSVWVGPHSLLHRGEYVRNSSIQAAIETFMK